MSRQRPARFATRCVALGSLALLVLPFFCHRLEAAAPDPAPSSTARRDLSTVAGSTWEFRPEGGDWKPIRVPGGGWRAQGYTCDAGTYRTTITLPNYAADRTVRIAFAAINFGADIYAGPDDQHLTKVASHIDGWLPVTADLTTVASPGKSLLLRVEVKGRRKFMVGGKYTVPEGATWDPHLEEGILRGVTLEILPKVHIDNIFVKTQTGSDPNSTDKSLSPTIEPVVTVTNSTDRPVTAYLDAHLSSADRIRFPYPSFTPMAASIAPNSTKTIRLPAQHWTAGPDSYWWPNVPYRPDYRARLHNLSVTLAVDGRRIHTEIQRFGFRSFVARGNAYYLNNIRCNLRGDNQQEADFDTDAYGIRPGFGPPSLSNNGWPEAVDNLLRLNFNVLRIHQIPATPYMLDVCDERGLMVVDESPLRGSEGGESYKDGKDNMLAMDRELVARDRNHPAVVLWSAANEWSDPIRDCIPVIREQDDTRPIIADGIGDMGPDVINMEHYVNGIDGMPVTGGRPRADRPYGETEAVWSRDNSLQGFAWMATSVLVRRLLGDADLRNYVLNNAWPNYVPGENPENEVLEKRVKHMDNNATILPAIADPWHNPNIVLMQRCYNPVAACDIDFDRINERSNRNGDWPVTGPRLTPGMTTTRHIAVFNDEFSDPQVTLRYELHQGDSASGPLLAHGEQQLTIPLGAFESLDIPLAIPSTPGHVTLSLVTLKGKTERFHEDRMVFRVAAGGSAIYPAGSYQLISFSGQPATPETPKPGTHAAITQGRESDPQYWDLEYVGDPKNGDIRLLDPVTHNALGIETAPGIDGTNAVELPATPDNPAEIWHLADREDGTITLTNKASGKLLDVYARATKPGSRICQWTNNDGENQRWELRAK